eukprot:TRINITY_DN3940_c0_g1_i1.p1 TRINITY_DN3940_c0_g1~~TRINITY_DN3940_c0_g1_i1.p1  ORF type:complete len:297 (-),score=28.85 TRINITY_DN3940_c0_g1_i1:204-1094(-)
MPCTRASHLPRTMWVSSAFVTAAVRVWSTPCCSGLAHTNRRRLCSKPGVFTGETASHAPPAAAVTMASPVPAASSVDPPSTGPPARLADAVVYIATSIDGYIAGTGSSGPVAFLDPFNGPGRVNPDGSGACDDLGYAEHMTSIDALVMGRTTYDVVTGFDGGWPYKDLRVVVLTSRPLVIPAFLAATVSVAAGLPAVVLADLAAAGVRRVWVDGGRTIGRFLAAGLVSRLTLTTVPVMLGAGVPLLGGDAGGEAGTIGTGGGKDRAGELWSLTRCRSWPDGVVQRTYVRGEGAGGS